MTAYQDYFSQISRYEQEQFRANKASLELDVKNLETRDYLLKRSIADLEDEEERIEAAVTILNEENSSLRGKNSQLSQEIDQLEIERTALSVANSDLDKQRTNLLAETTRLGISNSRLREEMESSKRALEAFEQRVICGEIEQSLRNVSDLAYSMAATMETFNFGALASIAETKNYLPPDKVNSLEYIGYDSWYVDWKPDAPWVGDDPFARTIGAQLMAEIVVGAIDVGSYFSPFSDGTDADRDYPLSRLIGMAINRTENEDAKTFLTDSLERVKAREEQERSSLFPNVSNESIDAVRKLRSNRIEISKEHLVEFSNEAIRLREAHTMAQMTFGDVMSHLEGKCGSI